MNRLGERRAHQPETDTPLEWLTCVLVLFASNSCKLGIDRLSRIENIEVDDKTNNHWQKLLLVVWQPDLLRVILVCILPTSPRCMGISGHCIATFCAKHTISFSLGGPLRSEADTRFPESHYLDTPRLPPGGNDHQWHNST